MFAQSEDGKTRTNVFVMIVTEMLDDWEDATAIGKNCCTHLVACTAGVVGKRTRV